MERKLKIYRASAGSGKTFTLALEYMKLVIDNPYSYRTILAVTFTNKATGEMKERILSKLYGVANGTRDADDYMEKLCAALPHMGTEKIKENAGKAFRLMLHDYGHFRIQTIDAFFQTVLRGFAKELELSGDMEISLDGKELLNEAVDSYIKNLEPDTANIQQVIRYIEEQLDNGSDWHVKKEIKSFSENILTEEYQERGEKLRDEIEESNGQLLLDFYDKIRRRKEDIANDVKRIAENFFSMTAAYSIDDFNGKSRGAYGFFTKMRNGDMPEMKKTVTEQMNNPQTISGVCNCCDDIAGLLKSYMVLYNDNETCKLATSHYHQLGMLNNIAKTLKAENTRENRFLLADTTHLLSSMIDKNTTFIFEKIGTEIEHIFIDEFQDTSKLQWNCFRVLLEEILARGNMNLIVGDVKQSIYRWRNGDWKIMNNIEENIERGCEVIEFVSQKTTIGSTEYQSVNYRSDRRIISFNNAFFRSAVKAIDTRYHDDLGDKKLKDIMNAYSDVEQAYPQPKKGKPEKEEQGYVEVRIMEKETGVTDAVFNERLIAQLMKTLHILLEEKGVAPKDITILLRENKDIELILEAFKKEFPTLKIISDEAYKLSSSLTVSLAVAALRYIATPEDKINVANLLNLYNKVILKNNKPLDRYVSQGDLVELLPVEFRTELQRLKGLPVYELVEQLMAILGIENTRGEEAYIYAFLDQVSQYVNSKCADLQGLLDAWDEKLCNKYVPAENADSIQAMTIHKSKGLEFHTVIMPLCKWKLTGDTRSLLWCETDENMSPYNTLSLIPIGINKVMKETIFSEEYHKEFMYQIVDNLNLLYVAMTRAVSNLIIFTEDHESESHYIWQLLNAAVRGIPEMNGMERCNEEGVDVLRYGEIVGSRTDDKEKEKEKEKEKKNPFESRSCDLSPSFTFYNNRLDVRQSRELARFLATDEEKAQMKNIAEGELMHMVMSCIERNEDIDRALEMLTMQGLIDDATHFNRIKSLVERALSNPKAKEWFNGTYRLYNECTILSRSMDKARRPDRVMIKDDEAVVVDYKFGRAYEKHEKQVGRYMKLLSEMGYRNVKGYLWYVYKNEIKPVVL